MNKNEFIKELRKQLKRLPADEVDAAVRYYEEYIDDAGENAQQAIKELGAPAKVASQIIANFAIKDIKSTNNPGKTVWIVLLAIFASPIALPVAIALFVVVLAVFISLLATVVSLGAGALAVTISGAASFFFALFLLGTHFPTALFFMGGGLVAFAIGAAMMIGVGFIAKKCFQGITKLVSGIILRRAKA